MKTVRAPVVRRVNWIINKLDDYFRILLKYSLLKCRLKVMLAVFVCPLTFHLIVKLLYLFQVQMVSKLVLSYVMLALLGLYHELSSHILADNLLYCHLLSTYCTVTDDKLSSGVDQRLRAPAH